MMRSRPSSRFTISAAGTSQWLAEASMTQSPSLRTRDPAQELMARSNVLPLRSSRPLPAQVSDAPRSRLSEISVSVRLGSRILRSLAKLLRCTVIEEPVPSILTSDSRWESVSEKSENRAAELS